MVFYLSVDNVAVLVLVLIKTLLIGCHGTKTHTNIREATIVIEVLHRHLTSEVREHYDTLVGTFIRTSIAQWRHAIGKVEEFIHTLYTRTCGCHGW